MLEKKPSTSDRGFELPANTKLVKLKVNTMVGHNKITNTKKGNTILETLFLTIFNSTFLRVMNQACFLNHISYWTNIKSNKKVIARQVPASHNV